MTARLLAAALLLAASCFAQHSVVTDPGMRKATLSAWTSATSVNATQDIFTNHGAGAVMVHLVQTTTLTAGAINFDVTYDGTNWVAIPADVISDPNSITSVLIPLPYTLQASTNKPFLIQNKGWSGLRIKLTTVITGTGSVTPNYALLPYEPLSYLRGEAALTHAVQSAASTNSTNVKASSGTVHFVSCINTTSTLYYFRFYNLTTAPTCSSATGFIQSYPIPHGTGTGAGFGFPYVIGKSFTTGIGYCITGGGSSTDNTNAATGLYCEVVYK